MLSRRHWIATVSALAGHICRPACQRGPISYPANQPHRRVVGTRYAHRGGAKSSAPALIAPPGAANLGKARGEAFGSLSTGADDPNVTTLIYVHGNRSTLQTGLEGGVKAYNAVKSYVQAHERLRLLIWCWPSDAIRGPLKDARYRREVCEGQYGLFADTLYRLPPKARVGIIGYSYATRIASVPRKLQLKIAPVSHRLRPCRGWRCGRRHSTLDGWHQADGSSCSVEASIAC